MTANVLEKVEQSSDGWS